MAEENAPIPHTRRASVQFVLPDSEPPAKKPDALEIAPQAVVLADNNETNDRRRSPSTSTGSVSDDAGDGDTEVDPEKMYGCFGLRPPFLQCMNKTIVAVICICIANFLQGFANGVFGVMTSTLEKRFGFSSAASSLIASAYEVGPIPVLIVLMIFGKRIHRPIAMSIGMIAVALGSVIFLLPQFLAPAYQPPDNSLPPQTCDALTQCDAQNGTTAASSSESLSYFLPVFIVGRLLIGFGSTPILTFGINYIDDCSSKEKFASYFGLYMAMNIMGPTCGALASSLLLNIYCNFYDIPPGFTLTPKDPRWIGAWWLSYAIVAAPSLLIAIPLWGFPRDLPGAAEIRANKVSEVKKDKRRQSVFSMSYGQPSFGYMWHVFTVRFKSIVTNPMFWLLTVYLTTDKVFLAINAAFGAKYFAVALSLNASAAGLLFVCMLLPAGFFGTMFGGWIIKKLRMTCRQVLILQLVAAILTTAGTGTFYLPCPTLDVAGITVPYNASSSSNNLPELYGSCNANCSCVDTLYQPICGANEIQYFSPCFAGCSPGNRTSQTSFEYTSCSCIQTSSITENKPAATTGVCSVGICTLGAVFLAFYFFASFFLQVTNVSCVIATLRVISQSETTVAVGFQVLISKVFGMIPSPILMGLGFDAACIWWNPVPCNPDGKGSCILYDTRIASNAFASLQMIAKGIGIIAMIIILIIYKQPSHEEHDHKDGSTASVSDDEDSNEIWKEPTDRKHSSGNALQHVNGVSGVDAAGDNASKKSVESGLVNTGFNNSEQSQDDTYKF